MERNDRVFTVFDPFGRSITLLRATWEAHVLASRPWMTGYESYVARTIQHPGWINFDVDSDRRECFYAEQVIDEYPHLLLEVVVEFDDTGSGLIITAYPMKREKPLERRKWPGP